MDTVAQADSAVENGYRRWQLRHWLLAGLGLVLGLTVIAYGVMWFRMMQPPPDDLDLATTQMTANGLYRASIQPAVVPIPVNEIHTWTLHVESPDGYPVEGAQILVDGDMPQHGHGLPTSPRVTEYLGNGDYLLEGMKFQMGGWWVIDFTINQSDQPDTVRFNLVLD